MTNRNTLALSSDEELMRMIQLGEVLAFDVLYQRYSQRLLVYFVRMMNFNRATAEDALQDLFLKIAEKPERFDHGRPFRTWVYSVAHNACKNFYRHKQVVSESVPEIAMEQESFDNSHLSIAAKMDAGLFRRKLDESLQELPFEKREAFLLRYQEHKTIEEIALIQDCPAGSVKSRLHYAHKILSQKLIDFKPSQP